jgi:hypothetical protein
MSPHAQARVRSPPGLRQRREAVLQTLLGGTLHGAGVRETRAGGILLARGIKQPVVCARDLEDDLAVGVVQGDQIEREPGTADVSRRKSGSTRTSERLARASGAAVSVGYSSLRATPSAAACARARSHEFACHHRPRSSVVGRKCPHCSRRIRFIRFDLRMIHPLTLLLRPETPRRPCRRPYDRSSPYLRSRPYSCVREMPSCRAAFALFPSTSRMTRWMVRPSMSSRSVVFPVDGGTGQRDKSGR